MANSLEKVKAYISPAILSAFCMVIWSLITEIRSDVKMLLKTSAQNDVIVAGLERRMNMVEGLIAQNRLFAIKPEEIEVPKKPDQQRN